MLQQVAHSVERRLSGVHFCTSGECENKCRDEMTLAALRQSSAGMIHLPAMEWSRQSEEADVGGRQGGARCSWCCSRLEVQELQACGARDCNRAVTQRLKLACFKRLVVAHVVCCVLRLLRAFHQSILTSILCASSMDRACVCRII